MMASHNHSCSPLAFVFTTFNCLVQNNCLLFLYLIGAATAELSPDFYNETCPDALSIIESAVNSAVKSEPRMGASLLRLHFHDCFVNGCDASILLDDIPCIFKGEKTARPNANSVRGYEVVDAIKSQLEAACPGVVSCADILAVAARDSVVALRGPNWRVILGRRDSETASFNAADSGNIPGPSSNLTALITAFAKKGFTFREMVALSGSHTIGEARCTSFKDRIYNDTDIDASFKTFLQANCPRSGGDNNTISPLDIQTPTCFDNAYYTNLVNKKGLLHSDQQLFSGGGDEGHTGAHVVNIYRTTPTTFFSDFAKAMVKMANLSLITGTSGQIRINCRKTN